MQNLISAFSIFLMRSMATAHSAPWSLPFRYGHMTDLVSFISKYMIFLHYLYIELLPHYKLRECYRKVTILLQRCHPYGSNDPCRAGCRENKRETRYVNHGLRDGRGGMQDMPGLMKSRCGCLFPSQGFRQEQCAVVIIIAWAITGASDPVGRDWRERSGADVLCHIVIRTHLGLSCFKHMLQTAGVHYNRFHFRPHFL